MRGERVWQVLRMYTSHVGLWLLPCFWLLFQVLSLFTEQSPIRSRADQLVGVVLLQLMASILLGIALGASLKSQFAHWRSWLLPGFAVPHLAIAGGIIALAVAFQVVLTPRWLGIGEALALAGLAFFAIASTLWMLVRSSPIIALAYPALLIVLCVSVLEHSGEQRPVFVDSPVPVIALSCLGCAALRSSVRRLSTISKDVLTQTRGDVNSAYSEQDAASQALQQQIRRIYNAPATGWLRDVQFQLVFRERNTRGPWHRLLLRQFSGGFPGVIAILGLCVYAPAASFMLSTFSRDETLPKVIGWQCVFFLSLMPMLMVLSVVSNAWFGSWPGFAMESLRPLERREFVRGMFRSCACDLGAPVIVHCACVAVCWNLVAPSALPPNLLFPWLVLIVATYTLGYSLMLWSVSFRNSWVMVSGSFTIVVLSAISIHTCLFGNPIYRSPLCLTLVLAGAVIAAMLIYRLAFRRWCHVDLA